MSYSQFIPPYDPIRYRHVMENAARLKTELAHRSSHLRKTKACMNAFPHDTEKCPFAHSIEEYRLPECFYAEFCKNNDCVMFHPGRNCTLEEYVQKNNIVFLKKEEKKEEKKVEKRKAVGLYTRFCNLMTETTPCPRGYCTFAHGLDQLNLPEESGKDRLTIAKELGYDVKDWMMRPHQENMTKKESRFLKAEKENDKMMEELRKEEDELTKRITSLKINEEEDDDDDDDDRVIVITNQFEPSKSGISLSEYISRSNSPVFTRME